MRDFVIGPSLFRIACTALLMLFSASCAELQEEFEARGRAISGAMSDALRTALAAPYPRPAYWHGDNVAGRPKIVVHLHEQRAYFYKGKRVVGESNISTGRRGFETPPGKYRIIQKDADHVSNQYGDYVDELGEVVERNIDVKNDPQPPGTRFVGANMPYFLRFTRGYGMHAGFVPRYRASHGCIRMPEQMAKHFFEAAEEDTPVIVKE